MDNDKTKRADATDRLNLLVRCCGSCGNFDSEDISGGGWCSAADHATACGDDCPDWHDDFYTPNDRAKFPRRLTLTEKPALSG